MVAPTYLMRYTVIIDNKFFKTDLHVPISEYFNAVEQRYF